MNSIIPILLYLAAALTSMLGFLVLARNSHSKLNKLFLALTIASSFWILTNVLFRQFGFDTAYYIGLLSYGAASAIAVCFFYFTATLNNTKIPRFIAPISIVFICVSVIPGLLATGVDDEGIKTTSFILLYAVIVSAYFIIGIIFLINRLVNSRGIQKKQAAFILTGLAGAIIGGLTFNLILPLQGQYSFVELGPTFSLFFVLLTTYSIVRHRFFDVRATIARLAAYTLTLTTLSIIYALAVYVVARSIIRIDDIDLTSQIVYLTLIIFAAISFQPLKKFFDKISKRLFYHDAYDSQDVLDSIGEVLVREKELDKLAIPSLKLVHNAVKSEFVVIQLTPKQTDVKHLEIKIGNPKADFTDLLSSIPKNPPPVIVLDEIEDQSGRLYEKMQKSDISIIAKLETSKELIGYALFGYKTVGGVYTSQDIELIKIAADEFAIAFQNALRFEEISRFNVTLQEEIRDATKQLRENNKRLQELDKAKDEFMSMASHQLRTPLTSVKGYISMILEGDMGTVKDSQRKVLNEAFSSTQRMVYLISDFLNVSRIQTGKFIIEKAPTKLADLVEGEVKQLEATAAGKGIKIDYQKPDNFPDLELDAGKISQVVMNFTDNAIYYSKPDTTIKIELSSNGKDVTFKVKDQGIGVPAHERPHLFSKFYRAENARKVRPDGTGIGLFMAKKVIVGHEGAVIFESTEGKGSTFGFILPLSKVGVKKSTETVQTAATR